MVNLGKMKNWNEIKKSSRWVNVEFQAQGDNREAKHFGCNFIRENTGDMLSFTLKLVDDKNNDIEFESGEKKKVPNNRTFNWIFSMNRLNQKSKK